jgi:aldose 1-epimerase
VPTISREDYGEFEGRPVERYTLRNDTGLSVQILTYGGIVQRIEAPDAGGRIANVVLGFATLADYVAHNHGPYFGAITGRFANRIAGATFPLDGARYGLAMNNGRNCLHGGIRGFNAHLWEAEPAEGEHGVGVRLIRTSPDGEEGFPGRLDAAVTYWLDDGNTVRVDYVATTDRPTIINLTNHTYFNLAGEDRPLILDHELRLNCSHYTPTNGEAIPTGEIAPVAGSPFDFTKPRRIGERIRDDHEQLRFGQGYDHNFVIDREPGADHDLTLVAEARDPESGRTLVIRSTEPGVQFYSGNFLFGTLAGTSGLLYRQSAGFALETQHFPDSPNQPKFPSTVLWPGETFTSTTTWTFAIG